MQEVLPQPMRSPELTRTFCSKHVCGKHCSTRPCRVLQDLVLISVIVDRKKKKKLIKEIFQFGITLLSNYITVLCIVLITLTFFFHLISQTPTYSQILQLGIKLLKPPFLLHAAEEQLLTQKFSTMLLLRLSGIT